jgi:hypothetical protein
MAFPWNVVGGQTGDEDVVERRERDKVDYKRGIFIY